MEAHSAPITAPRTPAELLGAIRILADRARQAEASRNVVEILEATTDRVGWLFANRSGDVEPLLDPLAPLELPPLERAEGVPGRLQQLAAEARANGVEPELTAYVEKVARRLRHLQAGSSDLRAAPRRQTNLPARLSVKGQTYPVTMVDRSVLGFGLLSPVRPPVEKGDFVTLIFPEAERTHRHECLLAHCIPDPHRTGFRIGLDVFGQGDPDGSGSD
jgi:hypothetical protein